MTVIRWVGSALAVLLLACQGPSCCAQDTVRRTKDPGYWALRVAGGYQRAGYAEVGVSFFGSHRDNFASEGFYSSVEFNFPAPGPVYGVKAGYETTFALGFLGLEFKELTNFTYSSFAFTPKGGIGLGGFAALAYGYNLQKDDVEALGIGKHQVSLLVHLSPRIWREFWGSGASQ